MVYQHLKLGQDTLALLNQQSACVHNPRNCHDVATQSQELQWVISMDLQSKLSGNSDILGGNGGICIFGRDHMLHSLYFWFTWFNNLLPRQNIA